MIPIRTDYRMRHTPWANYALLAGNVLLYVLGFNGGHIARVQAYLLYPDSPQLHQFFSAMFLHENFWHLFGNMVFLWVFGNAINDRFGHPAYLAFYLAGGVLAGIGYVLLAGRAPVLGASGAISAVTGAYLVLFPRVRVTLLAFFLYVIMPIEVSSLIFLAFQAIWNAVMSLSALGGAGGGVAYAAHSSGYAFGIVVAAVMLATRVLPRDAFDLPNLIRNWRRRGRFRRVVSDGYDPFRFTPAAGVAPQRARRIRATSVTADTPDTPAGRELQLRREIAEACNRHDVPAAAELYLQLVQIAEDAVLSQPQQLDVANQLMANQQYPAAADAYERFLSHYRTYEHIGDIYLMLGVIYGRYLHQYARAEEILKRAIERLRDPAKLQLAKGDLAAVRARGTS